MIKDGVNNRLGGSVTLTPGETIIQFVLPSGGRQGAFRSNDRGLTWNLISPDDHGGNVYAFCRWGDDLGDEIPDKAEALRLLEWWQQVMEIPCVAIGGITPANGTPLVAAGADFLAVSGAVWKGDEAEAVRAFTAILA